MPPALLPLNEAERLAALDSYQVLDGACDEAFSNIATLACRLIGCPTALVSLVDADNQWFKGKFGISGVKTPRDVAFCAHAILDPAHPLIVNDAQADSRFIDNPLVTGEPGIRFYAGTPLITPDGHALGTLCVIDYVPRQINADELAILSHLAQAAMATLEPRKVAEQIRRTAQTAVERFARVIDELPAALVLSGKSGDIQLLNRQAEQVFGYKRADLVGQPVELLLPDRFHQANVDLRQTIVDTMSSYALSDAHVRCGLHKDGHEFPMEIGLSPIDLEEAMVLAVMVDVSPRLAIEAERSRQRLELERSNADLQEFAYAASHDLKAPLRAIANLAEWIREDVAPIASPETTDNLTLLQGRVIRLQTLLDGLLAYSRVNHTWSESEDVDIAEVVRETADMLGAPPGFEIVCDGKMPIIRTHRIPIEVVFKNLLSNAVHHHDRSSGRIVVSMRSLDGVAEFRVSDDGPGIPKQFQKRIFVIFQTLNSRDDKETNGIGLAIVKKKVEYHGGQIRVESDPPKRGSTFIFTWNITLP